MMVPFFHVARHQTVKHTPTKITLRAENIPGRKKHTPTKQQNREPQTKNNVSRPHKETVYIALNNNPHITLRPQETKNNLAGQRKKQ